MFNKDLSNKLDSLIKEKFPLIYDYDFEGYVFLFGGTIRSLIMGTPVKDLDFVILTQGKCQIIDFIRKFKLKYIKNAYGGYKIFYKDFAIDMCTEMDLMESAKYNIDFIFYDIKTRYFISLGAIEAIENATITEMSSKDKPLAGDIVRKKKLIRFLKFVSGGKKIKVEDKKILFYFLLYKKKIQVFFCNLFYGNFNKCCRFLKQNNIFYNFMMVCQLLINILLKLNVFLLGFSIFNMILKEYKVAFLLICLFFIIKIILKLCSFMIINIENKCLEKMKFNVLAEISRYILCYRDKVNCKSFMSIMQSDVQDVIKYYAKVCENFIRMLSLFIILLIIICMHSFIGILVVMLVGIIYLGKRRKIRKKCWKERKRYNLYENSMRTYGEIFDSDHDQSLLDYNNYEFKYNKNLNLIITFILFSVLIVLFVNNWLLIIELLICIYIVFIDVCCVEAMEFDFICLNYICVRLFNLLDGTTYMNDVFGNDYKLQSEGNIVFENVLFRCGLDNKVILNDCSFSVSCGEVLLIDLNNESNMIFNLIARLYHVDNGMVKIDGLNVDNYCDTYIRENVAIVSSDTYFWNMSIKDNFRLINKSITDEEIKKVCKLVCLDKFIETLPDKYDTIIGDDGIELDEVYKFRLGIARAIIKNIKILLLEYKDSDDKIVNIINKIKNKYTIIIATDDKLLVNKMRKSGMKDSKILTKVKNKMLG